MPFAHDDEQTNWNCCVICRLDISIYSGLCVCACVWKKMVLICENVYSSFSKKTKLYWKPGNAGRQLGQWPRFSKFLKRCHTHWFVCVLEQNKENGFLNNSIHWACLLQCALCLRWCKIRSNFNHVNGLPVNNHTTFVVCVRLLFIRRGNRRSISFRHTQKKEKKTMCGCELENCIGFHPIKSSFSALVGAMLKTMDISSHSSQAKWQIPSTL